MTLITVNSTVNILVGIRSIVSFSMPGSSAGLTRVMLAPRLLLRSSSGAAIRPFSVSAVHRRSPTIRDITPEDAAQFNARQKEFRENLEAARKRREQQESQSVDPSASFFSPAPSTQEAGTAAAAAVTATAPTAPGASNASGASPGPAVLDAATTLDHQALSSLSTHRIVGDQPHADAAGQSQRRGPLSSFIYGTKEGQHFDQDIERSFSQVLARGKYVHSIVFHEVYPDRVDEYVDLVGKWYPHVASLEENKVNLVGSWRTQVGDNDTFGRLSHSPPSFASSG